MRKGIAAAFLAGFAATATGDAPAQTVYLNAFAGMAVFDSTVTVGGVKLVDQGGDAALAGLRVGAGHRFGSGLYLGAEAEAFGASGRSRAWIPTPTGPAIYSRSLRGGAGAFARIGWAPGDSGGDPTALLFARAGVQLAATNRGDEWVPAVGGGAEVRLTRRTFARVDLTYAWNTTETYQGTVALGWRFGP